MQVSPDDRTQGVSWDAQPQERRRPLTDPAAESG